MDRISYLRITYTASYMYDFYESNFCDKMIFDCGHENGIYDNRLEIVAHNLPL